MTNPHCVYCDADPGPLLPFNDIHLCRECGEVSFLSGQTWRPMYETTIEQEFTETVAKYFFKRLKFIVNLYKNT